MWWLWGISKDVTTKDTSFKKCEEFCSLFILRSLITTETCFNKDHKSISYLILTNKASSFQKMHITETSLSDYYKLTVIFPSPIFVNFSPKQHAIGATKAVSKMYFQEFPKVLLY